MGAKQIHVEVTAADIRKADPKNSSRCVVATAIARSIPDATRINVDVQTIRFTSEGERQVYLTPYGVAGYVVAFDAGDEIHPFTFRLREDQRVNVARRRRTPAGKAVVNATKNERQQRRRAEAAATHAKALAEATPEERKAARSVERASRAALVDAEAERAAVLAAYEGQPRIETPDKTRRQAPARVFARKERAYGMRLLRVNRV